MQSIIDALTIPGIGWLIFAATLAGLVRGFSGFGNAMIFMPLAAQVVPPVWALVVMAVMDVIGPLPSVPRCLKDGHPRDVLRLGAGLILTLPLGIMMLNVMAEGTFRTVVSALSLSLLLLLTSGYRYSQPLTKPLIFGTGGLGGLLAGSSGLAGPPVIMLYMASTHPVSTIRANLMLYLLTADVLMLALFSLWGMLTFTPVLVGLAVAIPYTLANLAGAAMFRPEREKLYRRAAYVIIACSAVSGLPIWD
ncbi:MAG: sulfite exporter TauE/SafE family protein [Litoreibacter sp.]